MSAIEQVEAARTVDLRFLVIKRPGLDVLVTFDRQAITLAQPPCQINLLTSSTAERHRFGGGRLKFLEADGTLYFGHGKQYT